MVQNHAWPQVVRVVGLSAPYVPEWLTVEGLSYLFRILWSANYFSSITNLSLSNTVSMSLSL